MTKDEVYQQYEETLAKIDKLAYEARKEARIALREHLKVLRNTAHEELKAIRTIEQKTRRKGDCELQEVEANQ